MYNVLTKELRSIHARAYRLQKQADALMEFKGKTARESIAPNVSGPGAEPGRRRN